MMRDHVFIFISLLRCCRSSVSSYRTSTDLRHMSCIVCRLHAFVRAVRAAAATPSQTRAPAARAAPTLAAFAAALAAELAATQSALIGVQEEFAAAVRLGGNAAADVGLVALEAAVQVQGPAFLHEKLQGSLSGRHLHTPLVPGHISSTQRLGPIVEGIRGMRTEGRLLGNSMSASSKGCLYAHTGASASAGAAGGGGGGGAGGKPGAGQRGGAGGCRAQRPPRAAQAPRARRHSRGFAVNSSADTQKSVHGERLQYRPANQQCWRILRRWTWTASLWFPTGGSARQCRPCLRATVDPNSCRVARSRGGGGGCAAAGALGAAAAGSAGRLAAARAPAGHPGIPRQLRCAPLTRHALLCHSLLPSPVLPRTCGADSAGLPRAHTLKILAPSWCAGRVSRGGRLDSAC